MKIHFPDVEQADEHGIVWVGGKLTVENCQEAYARGIFPWPHEGLPLLWFCPPERGIMDFNNFHIPRSVSRDLKKLQFHTTIDQCFDDVIRECSRQKRSGQRGTWITEEMQKIYRQMHCQGLAHSIECWQGEKLVGGLYGVYIQGVFSGESMFHHVSGASKQCLISLVGHLQRLGHDWFDIQMVTPVLKSFGGSYISRQEYLKLLKQAQRSNRKWRTS
jgi:leucyl/phenylalanyl-tRNA---protein transferase